MCQADAALPIADPARTRGAKRAIRQQLRTERACEFIVHHHQNGRYISERKQRGWRKMISKREYIDDFRLEFAHSLRYCRHREWIGDLEKRLGRECCTRKRRII